MRFQGVAPPVVTPFRDGEVAPDWFKENLRRLGESGLSGYLVLGSNGEAVHLAADEKSLVMDAAREATPSDMWLMVGTGEASTRLTIALTREAADRGADAALVGAPFYFKESMKPDVLKAHFLEVAEASTIPIFIYNVPQFTGLNLEAPLVAELARHPNIAGIKDSSGNIAQLTEIRRLTPSGFRVFVGSALVFLPALAVGADGGILAAANVLPEAFVRVQALARQGAWEEARRLQWSLMEISRAVTVGYGIGGLKAAMEMRGYRGGEVRGPLAMPDQSGMAKIRELLEPWTD